MAALEANEPTPDDTTVMPEGDGTRIGDDAEQPRAVARPSAERAGDEIGPFRLVSKLGEGGFGTVWLAERREPFVQKVALKLVKAGMDSASVLARFEQERQALAIMNHPNVAKVLDGGITPTGRSYFAMEFVKGEPISDYCDRNRLAIRERLELFTQVCEAVHHAHTKGIVHRDLKPGNVLVARADGDAPQAKVIDFGVAKALTQRMSEHTVFTETGQMIGTPEYMSPEQAEPDATDIDTRSDVYALGVMLYEVLAGVLPFDPRELRSKAYREIQRILREEEPPAPSVRLSTIASKDAALATRIAEARREGAAQLARSLRGELEWIPLKAMRKDRARRYESAAAMARDLRNYLEGRPLEAAPESMAYRLRKAARRHRALVVGACAVAAALVFGLGLALWQWRRAEAQRATAERTLTFLAEDVLKAADPELGGPDTRLVDLLEPASKALAGRFRDDPMGAARTGRAIGEAYLSLGMPDEAGRLLDRALEDAGPGAPAEFVTAVKASRAEAGYRRKEGESAVAAAREALARAEALWGPADPRTVDTRNQLGGALKHAGQLDESEREYLQVLDQRQQAAPRDELALAVVRHNMNLLGLLRARAQRESGDAAGSARTLEAALAERDRITQDTERALGRQHPQALATRAERCGMLAELGRLDEALRDYPGLVEDMRGTLGVGHWRTLETVARHGRTLRLAKRHAEAAEQLSQALEGYRFVRGPAFGDTVAIGEMLAASLQETGRLDAAERVLRRAVADTAKPDPAACCRLSCRLASLLAAQKHDAEAAAARGACACPP